MTNNETLLEVSNLKVAFHLTEATVQAVDGVNFKIEAGKTLGIVGESGSGKSTVARCIARLIETTDGRIMLSGTEIAKMPARQLRALRSKVQIVFQDPYRSLNPRRTVGDSIIEGPMNYGTTRAQAMEKAERLMELVRLDPNGLDRYPHQFSGGQRQRICIARALVHNVRISARSSRNCLPMTAAAPWLPAKIMNRPGKQISMTSAAFWSRWPLSIIIRQAWTRPASYPFKTCVHKRPLRQASPRRISGNSKSNLTSG